MTRSGSLLALIVGVSVALALHAFMYGPQAAFIAEQFHARLRYTGTSLAYTFAGIIGGAVAPVATTWLLSTRPATGPGTSRAGRWPSTSGWRCWSRWWASGSD